MNYVFVDISNLINNTWPVIDVRPFIMPCVQACIMKNI